MNIPTHHVDVFADKVFSGNPAAVCLLDEPINEELMQSIAAELNLSETSFVIKGNAARDTGYPLRWFTPLCEIDLCGHGTLAAADVLFRTTEGEHDNLIFDTASGPLEVCRTGDDLGLVLPARPAVPADSPTCQEVEAAIGCPVEEVLGARDLLVIIENQRKVENLEPDLNALMDFEDTFGIIVTAPGDRIDFVSRFFAPKAGIPEDPVTGSAHCTLVPYWSQRLGRKNLVGRQLSKRGGTIACEDLGEKVLLSGKCIPFGHGELSF